MNDFEDELDNRNLENQQNELAMKLQADKAFNEIQMKLRQVNKAYVAKENKFKQLQFEMQVCVN